MFEYRQQMKLSYENNNQSTFLRINVNICYWKKYFDNKLLNINKI